MNHAKLSINPSSDAILWNEVLRPINEISIKVHSFLSQKLPQETILLSYSRSTPYRSYIKVLDQVKSGHRSFRAEGGRCDFALSEEEPY